MIGDSSKVDGEADPIKCQDLMNVGTHSILRAEDMKNEVSLDPSNRDTPCCLLSPGAIGLHLPLHL